MMPPFLSFLVSLLALIYLVLADSPQTVYMNDTRLSFQPKTWQEVADCAKSRYALDYGDSVSLRFNVTEPGGQATVHFIQQSFGALVQISLDGSVLESDFDTYLNDTTYNLCRTKPYSVDPSLLSTGAHILVASIVGRPKDSPIYTDFKILAISRFTYVGEAFTSPPRPSSTSTSSSISTSTPTSTSRAWYDDETDVHKTTRLAAIIGGVLGGAFLIGLTIWLTIYTRRIYRDVAMVNRMTSNAITLSNSREGSPTTSVPLLPLSKAKMDEDDRDGQAQLSPPQLVALVKRMADQNVPEETISAVVGRMMPSGSGRAGPSRTNLGGNLPPPAYDYDTAEKGGQGKQ